MSRIGGGALADTWTRPVVAGDLPGPRAAEPLARQGERESDSLEQGAFKSDRIRIGAGRTIGTKAFVH